MVGSHPSCGAAYRKAPTHRLLIFALLVPLQLDIQKVGIVARSHCASSHGSLLLGSSIGKISHFSLDIRHKGMTATGGGEYNGQLRTHNKAEEEGSFWLSR